MAVDDALRQPTSTSTDLRTTRKAEVPSNVERQIRYMMLQRRRRIIDSFPVFCTVAVISFALLGASTALTIVDAAKLNLKVSSWGGVSTAASITGGVALVSIVVLTICRLGCSGARLHRWILPWSCFFVAVGAAVLSINALVLKMINNDEVRRIQGGRADVTVQMALWAVANVCQMVFYGFVMLRRFPGDSRSPSPEPMQEKKQAPQRPPTPPTPLRMTAPPYALPQARTSISAPGALLLPDSKRSSWRSSIESLQHVVRPVTSKTKLLSSRGSKTTLSRDSSLRSTESIRSDAFDSWDTSTADLASIREAMSPSGPSKGTALEPIPGSRPASPANALEGPFPDLEESPSSYFSMPARPETAASHASDFSMPIKRTFIPASRSMTPVEGMGDESNIHPLFRSDSPTPPPAVSRDTIVMASPMGGQTMPAPVRPASRMRSASQLSNRAPSRSASRAPSRASSIDEMRFNAPSRSRESIDSHHAPFYGAASLSSGPGPVYEDSQISQSSSSVNTSWPILEDRVSRTRSSSPASRVMTPPIPEFILSASREGGRARSRSRETLRPGGYRTPSLRG